MRIHRRSKFTGELYDFQKGVLTWTNNIDRGIIGLDMGLGKTVITIALICQKQYQRTLIVVPLPIIEQWKNAVLKFTNITNEDICIYQGSSRSTYDLTQYRIVITTYDVVRNGCGVPNVPPFDCLVLDEAHKIRNKKTNTYKACLKLSANIGPKWLLTGTVIHNRFDDFNTLCGFLGGESNYYRLTKKECGLQLPARHVHQHILNLDQQHQEEYDQLYQETKEVYEDYLLESSKSAFSSLLTKILRLRQCCNHPDAILDKTQFASQENRHDDACSTKFRESIKIIKQAPKDDKIIIFSQWEHSLELLATRLDQEKIAYIHYNGSLNTQQRKDALKLFGDEAQVLLITIQSGGVGLDLSCANHVIIMDSWWNDALERQAVDRVYRIGQKKEVDIHHMYINDSIEDWIREIKEEKLKIDTKFHDEDEMYTVNKALLAEILHYYI